MQQWTIVVIAAILMGGVGLIALRGGMTRVPEPPAVASAAPSASARSDVATPDAGLALEPIMEAPPRPMPSNVPPLPADAPKHVRFGVVLFQYAGAELAPKEARSRKEAQKLAEETIALAQEDFDEAVKHGDPGSAADAGRIPRGILEPHLEYALFTLKKGGVHPEPLDTPRGYWILRRGD